MQMMTRRVLLIALLTLGLALAAAAANGAVPGMREPTWTGFYGPGSTGIFPEATPPTKVSQDDIAWQCELPSWGHGQPIEVGDRVFLMVEPLEGKRLFPALLCVDAQTGKILWDRELDQTVALPEAKRKEVLAAWKTVDADYAKRIELCRQYNDTKDEEALKAAGYAWNARWHKVIPADTAHTARINKAYGVARAGGFRLESWRHECGCGDLTCIGQAFSTPVSDGAHVWCQTAWGGVFCFDFDGHALWTSFRDLSRVDDHCKFARSPILWQGADETLLLSDIGNVVRAFDALTGELKWADESLTAHTIVSPAVIAVDGADILYAAGNRAYELPSGKPLTVEGWVDYGMMTLVKYDEPDVIFFSGVSEHCGWTVKSAWGPIPDDPAAPRAKYVSPAMVKFTREGNALKARVLWDGYTIAVANGLAGNPWAKGGKDISVLIGLLYYNGKLYHPAGYILDVTTAKMVAGAYRSDKRATPGSGRARSMANGCVYGLGGANRGRGTKSQVPEGFTEMSLNVYTVDGTPVAENVLFVPKLTAPFSGGASSDDIFSYGAPFVLGREAVYLRGVQWLIKVGGARKVQGEK